jgi:hypothetical protein
LCELTQTRQRRTSVWIGCKRPTETPARLYRLSHIGVYSSVQDRRYWGRSWILNMDRLWLLLLERSSRRYLPSRCRADSESDDDSAKASGRNHQDCRGRGDCSGTRPGAFVGSTAPGRPVAWCLPAVVGPRSIRCLWLHAGRSVRGGGADVGLALRRALRVDDGGRTADNHDVSELALALLAVLRALGMATLVNLVVINRSSLPRLTLSGASCPMMSVHSGRRSLQLQSDYSGHSGRCRDSRKFLM